MIIKSMSRKKPTFRQLVRYIEKEAEAGDFVLAENMYADGLNAEEVIQFFEENGEYLGNRKNGNYLYHEVISLEENNHIPPKEQDRALIDLTQQYVSKRAPGMLVFGRMHRDKDHLHFHLAISANKVKSRQRVRLSKGKMAEIQREVEEYKLERYPEFNQERRYTQDNQHREKDPSKKADREYALTHRTGKPSRKEEVKEKISHIFKEATTEAEFSEKLRLANLELYQRGQAFGVRDEKGRKYRLKTLGLWEDFEQSREKFKVIAEREADLSRIRTRQQEISLEREDD